MLALTTLALAYETDQVTHRDRVLFDAREPANAKVNAMLAIAVARANVQTRCDASAKEHHRQLARAIYQETAHSEYVRDRGEFSGLGFGSYSAWLETSPDVDRFDFLDRTDIYGGIKRKESLILGSVGVCSTVELAGIRVGTDKVDHFFEQGYTYFLESGGGRDEAKALRWGMDSERTIFGLLTSNAFSYADLNANWQGYRFYRDLLTTGPFRVGPYGCVEQTRPFDWADYVNDAWDEALNPNLYTRVVGEHVTAWLESHRDEVCAGWADWGPDLVKRRDAVLVGRAAYVAPGAPDYVDSVRLDALCEVALTSQ